MNAVAQAAPFRRDPDSGIVAGVLSGLAHRIGTDPLLVRILFVDRRLPRPAASSLLAYALAWAVVPAEGATATRRDPAHPRARPSRLARRRRRGAAHPLGAARLPRARHLVERRAGLAAGARRRRRRGAVAPVARAGGAPRSSAPEPARAPSRDRRARSPTSTRAASASPSWSGPALLFLSPNDALGGVRDAALAAIVAVLALVLILAPFLWRLGRNLAAERAERIRSQERAELAAHLHDSVLQTLTLMQKRADDPREVAALARRQERELRAWLFEEERSRRGAASPRPSASRREEVEDAHGVAGRGRRGRRRASSTTGAEAVVAAAREALTNAAKFAADAGPIAALRRGRERPPRGLRARPRPRLRPRLGPGRPPGRARVDHRADGAPRRHRDDRLGPRRGHRGRADDLDRSAE